MTAYEFLSKSLFKDIVQLKRWGAKGVPIDSPLLPKQSAMFLATP